MHKRIAYHLIINNIHYVKTITYKSTGNVRSWSGSLLSYHWDARLLLLLLLLLLHGCCCHLRTAATTRSQRAVASGALAAPAQCCDEWRSPMHADPPPRLQSDEMFAVQ
jgi:hypothetical protein